MEPDQHVFFFLHFFSVRFLWSCLNKVVNTVNKLIYRTTIHLWWMAEPLNPCLAGKFQMPSHGSVWTLALFVCSRAMIAKGRKKVRMIRKDRGRKMTVWRTKLAQHCNSCYSALLIMLRGDSYKSREKNNHYHLCCIQHDASINT